VAAQTVRAVLVRPLCAWCGENDATAEVPTRWGCAASLCASCAKIHATGPGTELVMGATLEPLLTADEAAAYLAGQKWTYAKSMPKTPHEYVLLRKSTDPWAHLRVIAFIRATGEPRPWRWPPRTHHYWQPGDGWEYWTMRESDTILNRRRIDTETS